MHNLTPSACAADAPSKRWLLRNLEIAFCWWCAKSYVHHVGCELCPACLMELGVQTAKKSDLFSGT